MPYNKARTNPSIDCCSALGYGLSVPRVARDLADAYSTMDALMQASEDQIADVHGIGVKIAASVRDFMDRPENQRIIEQLRDSGLRLHH